MADREQKIKVTLDGELKPLIDKLAEAVVLMKAFGDKVADQQRRTGAKAGRDAGEALMAEYKKAVEAGTVRPGNLGFDKYLDEAVVKAKKHLAELQNEMRATGNIDVFQKMRQADKDLKALTGLEKQMGEAVKSGFWGGLQNGWNSFWKSVGTNPAVAGAVAAAIIAGSPLIGAAFSGALLAAGGLSAIGLGIAMQIKAPEVQTALGNLKSQVTDTFTTITAPMAGPITAAVNALGNALRTVAGPLEKVFAEIAPYINEIAQGLGKLVVNAAPGFVDFLRASEPLLKELSKDLPGLGHVLMMAFEMITQSQAGAVDGLHALFIAVEGVILVLAALADGLSYAYKAIETMADKVWGLWEKVSGLGVVLGLLSKHHSQAAIDAVKQANATDKLAGAQRSAADAAKAQADALDALNKKIEDNINQNLSDSEATIRQKQSVEDLTVSIAQNGNNWDINTDAGRKNTTALNDAIAAADKKRQADVKNGQDAVQAAQDYNQEVNSLFSIASQAGMTKTALDNLKGKYLINIDEVIQATMYANATPGSGASWRLAQDYGGQAKGNFIHAAAGLLTPRAPGTLVMAGEPETGGEYLIPRRGINSGRAAQLIGAAAADYGLSMGGDGAYLQVTIPVQIDSRTLITTTYEGFVNYSQERKNRYGSTGLT